MVALVALTTAEPGVEPPAASKVLAATTTVTTTTSIDAQVQQPATTAALHNAAAQAAAAPEHHAEPATAADTSSSTQIPAAALDHATIHQANTVVEQAQDVYAAAPTAPKLRIHAAQVHAKLWDAKQTTPTDPVSAH